MPLQSRFTICSFDLTLTGASGYPQDLIKHSLAFNNSHPSATTLQLSVHTPGTRAAREDAEMS